MRIDSNQYGGICACGKEHRMETRLCIIEQDALCRFDEYLAEMGLTGGRCVVYDEHTYAAVPPEKRPKALQEIVLDPEGLHADDFSTAHVLAQLKSGAEVMVAVGSGTVHDIVRYCAADRALPFVSVPTAASCDGFCSNVAAMTWEGYKKTLSSRAPVMVVADLAVISKAPSFLVASGVGDMLGKYTALADWQMSRAVTGEAVCPTIFHIMKDATDCIMKNAVKTVRGDLDAFEAVTYGLVMSGIAMQMMGNSRPASGGEHHISHIIESAPVGLGVHSDALHGEKVGVGTLLASREYHRLAEMEDISDKLVPFTPIDMNWLEEFFGEKLYPSARAENEHDCLAQVTPEKLAAAWPEMRKIIAAIPTEEALYKLLEGLGAKRCLEDIGVPEEKRQLLLDTSPMIRNRLTLMRMRRMLRG